METSERTEKIFEEICFSNPISPESYLDVVEGIHLAMELDERPVFLEGLVQRLHTLGFPCSIKDTQLLLKEVRRRFQEILHKNCPKAIANWIRGITPGTANRQNHYDLCYALEMNLSETTAFFQKCFLTIPFNCKDKTDAIYLYCLYHEKPYGTVAWLLSQAKDYKEQPGTVTQTSFQWSSILHIQDDTAFLSYLFQHCHSTKDSYRHAKEIIRKEIIQVKQHILSDNMEEVLSVNRLNSLTIAALLGYRYQRDIPSSKIHSLPKRFVESLPNDVILGRILNNHAVSYESLRKTLMLLRFYNFYHDAENTDAKTIAANLLDFYDELNSLLVSCGFSPVYVLHPFDCLLLYCANSYDPLVSLYCIMESRWNPNL